MAEHAVGGQPAMIRMSTAIGLLQLLVPSRPIPKPNLPRRYDTAPLPGISEALAKVAPKKHRAPRKKHVCKWTDQEVWGAVILVFAFGIFIGWCI